MSVFKEQFNADTVASRYSEVLIPDGEPLHPRAKYDSFSKHV